MKPIIENLVIVTEDNTICPFEGLLATHTFNPKMIWLPEKSSLKYEIQRIFPKIEFSEFKEISSLNKIDGVFLVTTKNAPIIYRLGVIKKSVIFFDKKEKYFLLEQPEENQAKVLPFWGISEKEHQKEIQFLLKITKASLKYKERSLIFPYSLEQEIKKEKGYEIPLDFHYAKAGHITVSVENFKPALEMKIIDSLAGLRIDLWDVLSA